MPEISDESWAEVARDTRTALELFGRAIATRCLPGEPDFCGGTFAQHAAAHLGALKACADHQLSHAGPDLAGMALEVYRRELAELEAGCEAHA